MTDLNQQKSPLRCQNDVVELRLRAELEFGELIGETANPHGDRQSEKALLHGESN